MPKVLLSILRYILRIHDEIQLHQQQQQQLTEKQHSNSFIFFIAISLYECVARFFIHFILLAIHFFCDSTCVTFSFLSINITSSSCFLFLFHLKLVHASLSLIPSSTYYRQFLTHTCVYVYSMDAVRAYKYKVISYCFDHDQLPFSCKTIVYTYRCSWPYRLIAALCLDRLYICVCHTENEGYKWMMFEIYSYIVYSRLNAYVFECLFIYFKWKWILNNEKT